MSVRELRWRARGRLFCWLLLANMLGRGACVVANPFAPEFSPALGELAWDGGLRWQMPLTALQLEPGVEIDITLDHELVALDYGEVESRIAVRPLETGVYCRGSNRIVWNRPGAGSRVFSDRDRVIPLPEVSAIVGTAPVECYRQGPVRLYWSEVARRAWIEDSGWILEYESGSLVRFSSPSGRVYEATSHGRRVTGIRLGTDRLLAVDTEGHGIIECMTARGVARFHIAYSDAGQIERVTDNNKRTLAAFAYGPMGTVTAIRRASMPSLDLAWLSNDGAARGDSPNRFPVHLAKAGRRSYRYWISGGVIYMELSEPDTAKRLLRIGMQYGRIRWVKESD